MPLDRQVELRPQGYFAASITQSITLRSMLHWHATRLLQNCRVEAAQQQVKPAVHDPQSQRDCAPVLIALHAGGRKEQDAPECSAAAAGTSGASAEAAAEPPGQAPDLPIQLSAMRKADVSDFKGTVYVSIREYYEVSAPAPSLFAGRELEVSQGCLQLHRCWLSTQPGCYTLPDLQQHSGQFGELVLARPSRH